LKLISKRKIKINVKWIVNIMMYLDHIKIDLKELYVMDLKMMVSALNNVLMLVYNLNILLCKMEMEKLDGVVVIMI